MGSDAFLILFLYTVLQLAPITGMNEKIKRMSMPYKVGHVLQLSLRQTAYV